MILTIIVLLLILLVTLLPYITRGVRRTAFICRLRRICRLIKYKIRTANIFCLLFANLSRTYDLTVDTGRKLYAIKLWDEFYRNTNLIFNDSHCVLRRKKVSEVFGKDGKMSHSVYEKILGRLSLSPCENNGGRQEYHIFLFSGRDVSLYHHNGKAMDRISYGDKLYGMTVAKYKSFLLEMEK